MDLWRLVDENPREVQESTHLMTPSGDAPEHSTKSPHLRPDDEKNEQEIPATEACDETPEGKTTAECKTVLGNVTTALNLSPEEVPSNQQRREALFQIERLLLRVRPYDSIGFFYVQRELLHYLQLGEFQEPANSDCLI
ncbi:hypothetical protein C0J52_23619 [Blattella germanica]|nr:hypothetical protein C0J52_23619 [Blattella germanica]